MIFLCIFQQLILSEIMYNPSGSEYHNEFVEVFNTNTTDSIDLSQFKLSDNKAIDNLVHTKGSKKLAPLSYALIMDASYWKNSTQYSRIIPPDICIYSTSDNSIGSGGLSNSKVEKVILYDKNLSIIDSISYSLGAKNGYSYERRIHFGNEWKFSMNELGSPGFHNSVDHFIETITAKTIFDVERKRFHIFLKNHESDDRNVIFKFTSDIYRFEERHFAFKNSIEKQYNRDIRALDSIDFYFYPEINETAQYKLLYTMFIDKTTVLYDSVSFVFSPFQFPLWISYLRLKKPQVIELKNPTPFSIYIDFIELRKSKSIKKIPIQRSLIPNETIRLSRYQSEFVDIVDSNIPYLYTKNGYLNLKFAGKQDSISYHINSLAFSDQAMSIIPKTYRSFNYKSQWVINPNKDKNSSKLSKSFSVKLSPNPFSPNNDGKEDELKIKLNYKNYDTIQLSIYTIYGKKLKDIQKNETYFGVGEWSWNGKADEGQLLTSGVYILLFKGKRKSNGNYTIKKFPIVLVR